MLYLTLIFLFSNTEAWSVPITPGDKIHIESQAFQCSKAGVDCLSVDDQNIVIKDVQYIQEGAERAVENLEYATEGGLLVSYTQPGEPSSGGVKEVLRFFPLSKVGRSPDDEFYMCPPGESYTIKDNIETLVSEMTLEGEASFDDIMDFLDEQSQPTQFICKCLWVPSDVIKELGIDKKKIGDKPIEDIPDIPETDGPPDTPQQPLPGPPHQDEIIITDPIVSCTYGCGYQPPYWPPGSGGGGGDPMMEPEEEKPPTQVPEGSPRQVLIILFSWLLQQLFL